VSYAVHYDAAKMYAHFFKKKLDITEQLAYGMAQ